MREDRLTDPGRDNEPDSCHWITESQICGVEPLCNIANVVWPFGGDHNGEEEA